MDLLTGNTAPNYCTALGLAVKDYFQDKSRTVISNEEIGIMTSLRVVTIWRKAQEEAVEGNVPSCTSLL